MFFFFISKKLNWEVFTKNLVTFKKWDGVKDEKFQYYGSSLKNSIFRGVHKNPIYRGCLKRGLGQFADLIGGGFWGGVVDTPMHTMLAHLKTAFVNELINLKLGFFSFFFHHINSGVYIK